MKRHNLAFGRTLRCFRQARGLTQEGLAFESDLDRTYISLLELGSRSPTMDTIAALCGAMNITFETLGRAIDVELSKDQECTK